METKQIWLDTFQDQEDDYFKQELEYFIERYEKRYHTSICAILLIGKRSQPVYGNWNGLDGSVGYRLIQDLDQLLATQASDICIYVGEDSFVHADYFDHDGTSYSMLKLIPESAEDTVYACLDCDPCELDYAEFFQKKGQLKPTKFWPAK